MSLLIIDTILWDQYGEILLIRWFLVGVLCPFSHVLHAGNSTIPTLIPEQMLRAHDIRRQPAHHELTLINRTICLYGLWWIMVLSSIATDPKCLARDTILWLIQSICNLSPKLIDKGHITRISAVHWGQSFVNFLWILFKYSIDNY